MTAESVNLLRPGALDGIDILIGANSDERTSLQGGSDRTMSLEEFAKAMRTMYGEGWDRAYRATDPQQAYRLSLRSAADNLLAAALISAQYAKAHNSRTNTFVYYFNHTPPGRNAEFYGSFHSAELLDLLQFDAGGAGTTSVDRGRLPNGRCDVNVPGELHPDRRPQRRRTTDLATADGRTGVHTVR